MAHRDIKPDNVMITHQNVLAFIDFAKSTTERYTTGIIGTDIYAAPEVVNYHSCDSFAADMFELGATLYIILKK